MSETNLSQILAALAAQKGDGNGPATNQQGTPPIAHPPSNPPGYPPPYPVQTSPSNTGTYSFPPPSSTGNFDLSSIKPASSGSVNFDDGSTRRGGGDRHGSYDQGRGGGTPRRGFRSRSRSRSPPRGGRYADSYNPYRDERRDEARRSNGHRDRDRSMSPSRRYNDGSRGYTSGQDYGQDSNMETIMIDSGLVGLIIGRAGENLRRVETETGTRVQFMTGPENSGPFRLCKVTGPRQAREAAKAEINRIIADSGKSGRVMSADRPPSAGNAKPSSTPQPTPKSGEESKQIMVPDRTVGLIIGRGGETIRDLQERSGCHVNITSEDKSINGLRPVNLIGSPAATNVAKDLIMEIVDSDNKGTAGAGPAGNIPTSGLGGMSSGRSGGAGDEKINDTIRVPSEAVGMIIGKGGETIKDMQTVTGCKINIPQWSGQGQDIERITGLIGTRAAIEHAKRAIMEKVRAVEDKNRGGTPRGGGQDQQYNRYADSQSQSHDYTGSYGAQAHGHDAQAQSGASQADPYAAYGGYQNYVNMWYAAMQNQSQGGGQNQGQPGGGGAPA